MSEEQVIQGPGKPVAHRPLHFIFLLDCSGSMAEDGKIQALNAAVREAIPEMQKAAGGHPEVEVLVRVVTFSSNAQWHVSQPTPVKDFSWKDVGAAGVTDLGKAIDLIVDALDIKNIGDRNKPPVLALLSDGQPTDDWKTSLEGLNKIPWGKKAIRVAIAIGGDADKDVLQQFINNKEINVAEANNPQALVQWIKWVSTTVIKKASEDKNLTNSDQPELTTDKDVW